MTFVTLGDGAGSPIDQGVTTLLFMGAALLAWVAVSRLRGKAFTRLPRQAGWAAAGAAVATVVLALVLPPVIRPDPATVRPSTAARLTFVMPVPGQVFRGNPATVRVRLRLIGGRLVAATSTKLVTGTGHVHLYLDGNLVSMTSLLQREVLVEPGTHRLSAEFVAMDHAPFDPRVSASVSFVVQAGS